MSASFHYSPETGNTSPCSTTPDRCPFGAERHADTEDGAQSLMEAEMEQKIEPPSLRKRTPLEQDIEEELKKNAKLNEEGLLQEIVLKKAIEKRKDLDDQQFESHSVYVNEANETLNASGFSTEEYYAEADLEGQYVYTLERAEKHEHIIKHFMDKYESVPTDGKAIMAGGLGGAGKGSTMEKTGYADESKYATINPDDVKEEMAERGMIPKVKGMTPMDASPLAHEEASHISKRIATRLLKKRKNVLYDITMSNIGSAESRLNSLKANEYETNAVFVDIEPDTSKERGRYRYRKGTADYLEHGIGNGGRPLPDHVVDSQRTDSGMRSRNSENLVELERKGLFDSVPKIYDNMGTAPKEVSFKDFATPIKRPGRHKPE